MNILSFKFLRDKGYLELVLAYGEGSQCATITASGVMIAAAVA
jgi:hypothetical protein